MKTFLAALVLVFQLSASIWLAVSEGWVSGLVFFIVFAVLAGILLMVHDVVSSLFRPRNR